MKIKLHKALDLLAGAGAVIIYNHEDCPDVYPEIENDQIVFNWESGGLEYDITILFSENESVEIENSTMALIDEDGEIIELKLLFPTNLASFCQESDIT